MAGWRNWLDQRLYPDCGPNWDDELFRQRILRVIRPNHIVLDLGAGAGVVAQMNFRGQVAKICGVDLDERVRTNPLLDEGRVSDASAIPFPDETFDVVFADNLLEHLRDPAAVFAEVQRVLKPGGAFLFKTPNCRHYVPMIARITPHWFHRAVNRWRGRGGADVFPTLYRANSQARARRLAAAAGLELVVLEHVERRPEYLRMSLPTYMLGATYERLVNSTKLLESFRVLMIGTLRKSATVAAAASRP